MDGFNKHFFSKLNGRTGFLSLEETTYLKSKKNLKNKYSSVSKICKNIALVNV